ncbi:hypothetical protein VTN96DRAFT_1610 [Rasamsonia emersonii]
MDAHGRRAALSREDRLVSRIDSVPNKVRRRPSAGGGIGRSRHGVCTRNGMAAKKGSGASGTRFLGAVRLAGRSWRRVPGLVRAFWKAAGATRGAANGRLEGAWPGNEMSVGSAAELRQLAGRGDPGQEGACDWARVVIERLHGCSNRLGTVREAIRLGKFPARLMRREVPAGEQASQRTRGTHRQRLPLADGALSRPYERVLRAGARDMLLRRAPSEAFSSSRSLFGLLSRGALQMQPYSLPKTASARLHAGGLSNGGLGVGD